MKSLFGLLLAFSASTLWAADLPELVLPAGVGVNIHFTRGHERDLDLIAAAGFKFIRMDFAWGGIERKKGEYDWSAYDELTGNLEKRGLHALYILDYSNGLYEETVSTTNAITHRPQRDTASPQHPESVAAFARWAAASARHFVGRRIVWEIWNEPNIFFWKPKPDAQQYATLALATCKAIREADPKVTIIAPATSTFPWSFLETVLSSGALEYLDGVSVHPYRSPNKPPETAETDYKKLRELIDRYTPPNRKGKIPIISGEWGYSTFTKGVPLDRQANFIARQQLSNLLNGIPLSIWYDWKNDGNDPAENEHNFGTVTYDLQPKPAYTAIQTLTRELSGYRIARRVQTANDQDYVLVCTNTADAQKVAAWTLAEPRSVTLDFGLKPDNKVTGINGNGQAVSAKVAAPNLTLDLTQVPVYYSIK